MVSATEQASQRVLLIRGLVDFVVYSGKLELRTPEAPAFVDVTEQVQELVQESDAALGIVVLYSRHTTAGVAIQVQESLLMRDVGSWVGSPAK